MSAVRLAQSHLLARQQSVRSALAELKLDGLLLTHPPDLAYLTGFTGDDSVGLITQHNFLLVTDFRYDEQARIEAPWLPLIMRSGKMSEALTKAIFKAKVCKLGFESNFTPFGQVDSLKKHLKEIGKKKAAAKNIKLTGVDDVMVNIRKTKDDIEIGIIRKAIDCAEQSFLALRKQIKIGQTENFLAGLLGFEMRCRGASDSSFQTIIGAGPGSSLPHYRPGEITVKRDEPLLIDWGARLQGYCSDLTRTLLIGRVSTKITEIYKIVLDAQLAAIDSLKPGVMTRQADRIARGIIKKAGYDKQFGHGLGHGIGRDIHELPVLRKKGEGEELKPGMIVTVEPGIYLPGIGGVRIEDDVLITPGGHEVLSSLDKSIEGCHLD